MNFRLEPQTNERFDETGGESPAGGARLPVQFRDEAADSLEEQPLDFSGGAKERPSATMRVLLRDTKTRKYLRAGRRWTDNPDQAHDFRNGWGATDFAFTMNPRRLIIVYEFNDDRYNIRIPVKNYTLRIRRTMRCAKRRSPQRLLGNTVKLGFRARGRSGGRLSRNDAIESPASA